MNANSLRLMLFGVPFLLATMTVLAQQKVYKWVDEDGVVHFSETPPQEAVETETITTAPAPPASPATTIPRPTSATDNSAPTTPVSPPAAAAPVAAPDISSMSLSELDRRCEDAREKRIAPLRNAEIQQCKADERNDPNYCDTFYADYGDGGRTASGAMRPRMFDDLPECVDAMNERNRRPL